MASSPDFRLPPGVRPVAISVANFEKMMNEGRTFDDYFRYLEEQNYVDAQEGILQPEEIETLDEADRAAESPELPAKHEQSEKPDSSDRPGKQPKPSGPAMPAPAAPGPAYDPGSEGDDPLFDE